MAVFALSDLHLSFQVKKPMDIFGAAWHGYTEFMEKNWRELVSEEDAVLIPGDVSWATYLEQAKKDFEFIYNLPGIKYISKGNHDYWWETVAKMTNFLEENGWEDKIRFVHNGAFTVEEFAICATKGYEKETEEKLKNRELIRLENSLKAGLELPHKGLIAMLHYPPFHKNGEPVKEIFDILKKYGTDICIYGHIHSNNTLCPVNETVDGIKAILVSCNRIDFCPVRLAI